MRALRGIFLVGAKFMTLPASPRPKNGIMQSSPPLPVFGFDLNSLTPQQEGDNVNQPQIATFAERGSAQFGLVVDISSKLVEIADDR